MSRFVVRGWALAMVPKLRNSRHMSRPVNKSSQSSTITSEITSSRDPGVYGWMTGDEWSFALLAKPRKSPERLQPTP